MSKLEDRLTEIQASHIVEILSEESLPSDKKELAEKAKKSYDKYLETKKSIENLEKIMGINPYASIDEEIRRCKKEASESLSSTVNALVQLIEAPDEADQLKSYLEV